MKTFFNCCLLALSTLTVLFSGCKNNNEELLGDAKVTFFSFANTEGGLNTTFFTIDDGTEKGQIFNKDSIAFQTNVEKLIPIITGNNISKIFFKEGENNEKEWNKKDSIDFSSTVELRTVAENGDSMKYIITVNVCKINHNIWTWYGPTTIHSGNIEAQTAYSFKGNSYLIENNGIGNSLYELKLQNGAINSKLLTTTNFPADKIKSAVVHAATIFLLCDDKSLWSSSDNVSFSKIDDVAIDNLLFSSNNNLWGINNGKIATSSDGKNWSDGATCNFPAENYSAVAYKNRNNLWIGRVVSGVSEEKAVWGNEGNPDKTWIVFPEIPKYSAEKNIDGTSIFYYDDKMFALKADSSLYISQNECVSWEHFVENKYDEAILFPKDFEFRSNQTVFVDENNFVWFIGGKSDSQFKSDVWAARLNKLGLK